MSRPSHELLLSSLGAARAAGSLRVVKGSAYPDPDWSYEPHQERNVWLNRVNFRQANAERRRARKQKEYEDWARN